jgi:uncharacterized membrane protein
MANSTIAQVVSLCVIVLAICVLSLYDKLAGEAGALMGLIVGYLVNGLRPRSAT